MMIIQEILSKYFGYNKFRPNQKKIINYIIDKKNVLAILPTGGGKSICYQIPALINDGICIVISPLLALIDDQISLLKSRGIKSISISGNLTNIQIDSLLNTCIYSNVKFLYVSPERIRSELVRNKIALMNVNLIAIDEAHCISEWGHDFRPAYRNISLIKKITNDPPILALTATATQSVIDDIKENLEINDSVVVKGSLKRKNLCYIVERNLDKKQRLIEIVNKFKAKKVISYSA